MKHLVGIDSKLCDIVMAEPSVITVLDRFGIALGVGDKTIAAICAEHGLDRDFFATIINTYLNEDYFPDRILASMDAQLIISYFQRTNAYYEQFQLPNIERHFHLLLGKSDPSNNNLGLMMRFFGEMKAQLLARIADDRSRWFPEVIELQRHAEQATDATIDKGFDEDSVEDKIDDLIHMFVMHLKGDYDHNLCLAVIISLFNLKKDITQNNRIRNRILRPLAAALKSQQP
jgi:regulator of cell morphogenesis and NO signaling